MLKTVKVKKQMRLDELIKYVWENQLNKIFVSDKGLKKIGITIDSIDLRYLDNGIISRNDTFTVEVEETITEDTIIPKTVTLTEDEVVFRSWDNSINGLKKAYPDALQIHAIVNGKLQLIWEAE